MPGNFHVSTHSSHEQPEAPDMTHIIHKLRFGMDLEAGKVCRPIHKAQYKFASFTENTGKKIRGNKLTKFYCF